MIAITARLDQYWAEELGCDPADLHDGGVTVCAPRHREGPRWMGWLVPLECIVLADAQPGTGAVSVTPYLEDTLRTFLLTVHELGDCLPPDGKALVRFARDFLPTGYPKIHAILLCHPETFRPYPEVLPVELLRNDDSQADWFRYHFDGPIYVARGERGEIASWAAIKCKSAHVWEMAVATEANYRNRGLARSVVSRATRAALEAGKVPLYLHDLSNTASARVCRALGYQFYGHELTCESGRIPPTPRKPMGF